MWASQKGEREKEIDFHLLIMWSTPFWDYAFLVVWSDASKKKEKKEGSIFLSLCKYEWTVNFRCINSIMSVHQRTIRKDGRDGQLHRGGTHFPYFRGTGASGIGSAQRQRSNHSLSDKATSSACRHLISEVHAHGHGHSCTIFFSRTESKIEKRKTKNERFGFWYYINIKMLIIEVSFKCVCIGGTLCFFKSKLSVLCLWPVFLISSERRGLRYSYHHHCLPFYYFLLTSQLQNPKTK